MSLSTRRVSYRHTTGRNQLNLLDPGPHYYETYVFSGRTFRAPDIPGPAFVPYAAEFDNDFSADFTNPENP